MTDPTPETIAELRRTYEEAMRVGSNEMAWDEWTTAISEAADALLDEADRLAHMTEACNNARAEVERLTALVEAVREDASDIARDSGDDKGCYGVDFWAGMCKAAARIDSRIRHALDGLSHVDYLDDDGRKQRGRAVRAETEMERIAAERDALAAKIERVRALADEWTYKGEFGWDDGSHAYGTDCVVQALDYAAAELRRALDEEPQP